MRRRFVPFIAVIAAAAALSACGGGGSDSGTSSTTGGSGATAGDGAGASPASVDVVLRSGADIHVPVEASGTLPVTLTCSPGTTGTQTVAFGVPFPRGFVTDVANVRVESATGVERAADAIELARWRHFRTPALDGTSIRSVLLVVRHDCSAAPSGEVVVRWGTARTAQAGLGITPATVRSTWRAQAAPLPGEHPATDNYSRDTAVPAIVEPRVWASLPAAWLMKANLRGPVAPVTNATQRGHLLGFGKTYVNDVEPDVTAFEAEDGRGLIDFAQEIEGWLYDRPYALWNLYVQTGDVKWARHAHRASQYYASWIARDGSTPPYQRGAFRKKPPTYTGDVGDAKYSLNGGLFAAYLLTGDAQLLDPIRAIGEFVGSNVRTRLFPFDRDSGLWTERHLGVAIAGTTYAYEATGDASFRERTRAIVAGMREDVTTPPTGYPSAAAMRGVLFHRAEVHEGGSTPDLYMSPWMAALLGESLWHYYILSDDESALLFLSDYAQLIAERAIYSEPNDPHLGRFWAPYYGIGMQFGYTDSGIYDDIEHAADVNGLLKRGRYARRLLGLPTTQIDLQIGRLDATATMNFEGWVRVAAGLPHHRLAPTRKFGWWYGTTFDSEWFNGK
jgi:hypothetical protein